MKSIEFEPNAKINIGLFVISKRKDGYHNIETIYYPIFSLKDKLTIRENPNIQGPNLVVSGLHLHVPPPKNLCVKAYNTIKRLHPGLPGVDIILEKNIPAGSGLGGGSSDAAFTMLGLRELFDLPISQESLFELAKTVGADVAFFLENKPMYACGIGDELEALDLEIKERIEIITSPYYSDTTMAYKNIQIKTEREPILLKEWIKQPIETWKEHIVNDFEDYVFSKLPQLKKIKVELYEKGALFCQMTGTGSAIYAIFPQPKPKTKAKAK
ncbi:MAG: 4-(cytidine 5'-diphospho)-2-C-methyl-D-erythritol kinase [Bacteroidia bacterium]|nr:4-(cytidine 5'-diphospho)-2-C-methyl-D-erythritol kinase [Bacteroidia bacterium]MDW8157539.1 4-(cytidine 5'-diphospho)-2-C-methyl-D-erythritol kinase [Bacteroidia bacterium]